MTLTVKTAAATLDLFLQHYKTDSPLGIYLMATLENLQLELGVRHCPFQYDFDKWGALAIESWIKSL